MRKLIYFSILWTIAILLSYFFLDKPLAYYFAQGNNTALYKLAELITEFGRSNRYILSFCLFYLMSRFILKRPDLSYKALYLLASMLTSGFICLILKFILSRARPSELFADQWYGFFFFKTQASFWSFPSGHATTISTAMISLCLLIPYHKKLIALAISFLIAVCASRIIVTAHYLSDVLAGIYLGGFTALWLYYQFNYQGQLASDYQKNRMIRG